MDQEVERTKMRNQVVTEGDQRREWLGSITSEGRGAEVCGTKQGRRNQEEKKRGNKEEK